MQHLDLSGTWRCEIPGMRREAILPGTLDTNAIGFADTVKFPSQVSRTGPRRTAELSTVGRAAVTNEKVTSAGSSKCSASTMRTVCSSRSVRAVR